jgi:hypothetical protein
MRKIKNEYNDIVDAINNLNIKISDYLEEILKHLKDK